MARIRSIHPSLFTHRGFIKMSPLARQLYIGVLCEADDSGAFEWEPAVLKVRILPVDNCNIDELLTELVQAGMVIRYRANNTMYGLLRDFAKQQRPRRPHYVYPVPEDLRHYTGAVPANGTGEHQPEAGLFDPADDGLVVEEEAQTDAQTDPRPSRINGSSWQPPLPVKAPVRQPQAPVEATAMPPDTPIETVAVSPTSAQAPPERTPCTTMSGISPHRNRRVEERSRIGVGDGVLRTHPARAGARGRARNPLSDETFVKFWDAFPVHERLAESYRAWLEALEEASAADILAGLARFQFRDGQRYIRPADKWLRSRDWMSSPAAYDAAMRAAGLKADGTPLVEAAT